MASLGKNVISVQKTFSLSQNVLTVQKCFFQTDVLCFQKSLNVENKMYVEGQVQVLHFLSDHVNTELGGLL